MARGTELSGPGSRIKHGIFDAGNFQNLQATHPLIRQMGTDPFSVALEAAGATFAPQNEVKILHDRGGQNAPRLTRTLKYGRGRLAEFMRILTIIGKLVFGWDLRRVGRRPTGLRLREAPPW